MWNGFSMISKQPEFTQGILETLLEAERSLHTAAGTARHARVKNKNSHAYPEIMNVLCLETDRQTDG